MSRYSCRERGGCRSSHGMPYGTHACMIYNMAKLHAYKHLHVLATVVGFCGCISLERVINRQDVLVARQPVAALGAGVHVDGFVYVDGPAAVVEKLFSLVPERCALIVIIGRWGCQPTSTIAALDNLQTLTHAWGTLVWLGRVANRQHRLIKSGMFAVSRTGHKHCRATQHAVP